MDDEKFNIISKKIDALISIMAAGQIRGLSNKEAIVLLSRADLPPQEIAKLVGCSPNAVRITLHRTRRVKK